ncbi:MAG: radical SAM protein [Ignavibacteriales bacterium]
MSLGTASVMGLVRARVDEAPTTAYLMAGERCSFDCSFCPQARTASSASDHLSRVTWPGFDEVEVAGAFARDAVRGLFRRGCIQVVHSPGALEQAERLLGRIAGAWGDAGGQGKPPVSVSAHLTSMREARRLFEAGAERLGLPIDAATPGVYARVKGGSWDAAVNAVLEVAAAYPGRISTHFIAGLGETEQEMVRAIQMMHDSGIAVGLFAMTPVRGTVMADVPPPEVHSYRRLQAAHYLIRQGFSRAKDMSFCGGRLAGYGIDPAEVQQLLGSGEAFMTTGCPHCNRPYYNERPGGVMYNYPRRLGPAEAGEALRAAAGILRRGEAVAG